MWYNSVMKNKLIGFISILVLVAIDLWSKQTVTTAIAHNQQVEVIDNFFWLTHVHNTGAAWSLFNGRVGILTVVSFVAAIALIVIYLRDQQSKIANIALVLMIAGTIGNLYDRFALNYVRDFLSFNLFGYMFPVFNVADSLLVIGVFILIVEVLISERN